MLRLRSGLAILWTNPALCRQLGTATAAASPTSGRLQSRKRKRNRMPRTTPIPMYTISRLALDLNAEGCSAVREYNDEDAQAQEDLWSRNPNVDALVKRMEDFKAELNVQQNLWAEKVGPSDKRWISTRDVLSVAFLGAPRRESEAQTDVDDTGSLPPRQQTAASLTCDTLDSIGVSDRLWKNDCLLTSVLLRRLEQQEAWTAENDRTENEKNQELPSAE